MSLPVHQSVLEQRADGVDVVLAHLADVLKHERQRLEDAVLDVQLGHPVLVHQAREDGERGARFAHDGDGDSRAHAVLALLDSQVVEQGREDVVWPKRRE